MGSVTNVVLHASRDDDAAVAQLNEWIVAQGFDPLAEVSSHAAGTKLFMPRLLIAAYNFFPAWEFLDQVRAAKWTAPRSAVLLMQTEDDGDGPIVWQP